MKSIFPVFFYFNSFKEPFRFRTALVHDIDKEKLLNNHSSSFYVHWYEGPQGLDGDDLCGAAYFGIQKKYENIQEHSCTYKKCTACEITNTHEKTINLNMRGLCKDTYLDTKYVINYDPENIITYIGIERNTITYDFVNKIWLITVKIKTTRVTINIQ